MNLDWLTNRAIPSAMAATPRPRARPKTGVSRIALAPELLRGSQSDTFRSGRGSTHPSIEPLIMLAAFDLTQAAIRMPRIRYSLSDTTLQQIAISESRKGVN